MEDSEMKRRVTAALVALTIVTLSGCSTFELEAGATCLNERKDFGSHSETVHGSLWGFKWSDHTIGKCEDACGLYRVEYHTNAVFVLASVVTLGLYVPQTVEWWCLVEPRDDSDQQPWDPNVKKDSSNDDTDDDGSDQP